MKTSWRDKREGGNLDTINKSSVQCRVNNLQSVVVEPGKLSDISTTTYSVHTAAMYYWYSVTN